MSPIVNYPQIKYLGKGKGWVLKDEDLTYKHPVYGIITVPEGFRTDLDSVPRLPLAYMLTKNASVIGAIVHDYLYKQGKIGDKEITREEADDIMFDIMEDEGVSWWQKRMIRFGLRLAGWWAWNKHRKAAKQTEAVGAADGHNPPPPRNPPAPPTAR